MNYENLFKKELLKEENTDAINMSPDEKIESDEDAWAAANPEITNNDELNVPFQVEGLDEVEIEKYSKIIGNWGQGIENAIHQLAQIIKFSAGEKLAEAPGSEQFSALIKKAPALKSDLSAFKSQVEDLEQTVKLAISDAAKERKEKINSLKM